MTGLMLFLGRFHPIALHFPIGLLSAAFLLTLLARRERWAHYAPAGGVLLDFGAASAALAAVFGFFLSREGGYDASLVAWHQWSGISLAFFALNLAWLRRQSSDHRLFLPGFAALVGLMMWVGHLGGTLTHGSGFLTAHAPEMVQRLLGSSGESEQFVVIENVEGAYVYRDLVQPILEARCTECHNPIKRKSELDLSTLEGVLAGGSEGEVFDENGALASRLFRRVILPSDHEDAMPPTGKERLHPADVEVLGWWLDQGAPLDATVSQLGPDSRFVRLLRDRFGKPDPLEQLSIKAASQRALRKGAQGDLLIEQVADDGPYLRARLRPGTGDVAPSLAPLEAIADQLTELDLAGSSFGDEAAAELAALPHLRRLSLQNTLITDAALPHVAGLEYLGLLNVYGTAVSDDGIGLLSGLEHLEDLYAWGSEVTQVGAATLRSAIAGLRTEMGADTTTFGATRLPVPVIHSDSVLFADAATVTISSGIPGTELFYTLDGSQPGTGALAYDGPFTVTTSTQVIAVGRRDSWAESDPATLHLVRSGHAIQALVLAADPSPEYAGAGAETLRDGLTGTGNFRTGRWLGYRDEDLIATIDLGRTRTVARVTVGVLEELGSWIFFPSGLDVSISDDGVEFRPIGSFRYDIPEGGREGSRRFLTEALSESSGRYVRVRVRTVGKIPEWHPGKGKNGWVFVDEVMVGN